MHVIPVIDLKQGQVVRGVAGLRQQYRAVKSVFAADSQPATVARALADHFQFSNVYIADLDALAGDEPDWHSLRRIAASGLRLLCDVGISSPEDVHRVRSHASGDFEIQRLIVALESVSGPDALAAIFDAASDLSPIFSLDLRQGQPLTQATKWQSLSPLEIAEQALAIGYSRFIVLDLAHVGTGNGPAVEAICRQLRDRVPNIELISGGGVRDLADLQRFHQCGCDAVLVASALHDGSLTPASIRQAESW